MDKVGSCNWLNQVDLPDAYYQFELDEASQMLTVVNTHRGLFNVKRLPFSVSSAPALFQRRMETVMADLPVQTFFDDLLYGGKFIDDALFKLRQLFQRLREKGIKASLDKSQFLVQEVKYLGHRLDKNGIHMMTDRIDAILKMPAPVSVQTLRTFLGVVNPYRDFITDRAIN